jgi:hypothetical protein
MMPGAGGDVNTTLPLVLAIVGFFLCCGLADILFIIAFVFSLQAGNMKKTGDIDGARAKAKDAMTMNIIGFVVGFVLNTLLFVFVLNTHLAVARLMMNS